MMTTSIRNSWLALVLLSFATACYSPAIDDGKLQCSADKSCPDGYQCASDNHCYLAGSAMPPDAPTAVTATAGVRSATVTWTAPAHDGGSAITSYTVTATPGGKTASTADGSTLTASLSGLDDAIAYTFTVIATNALGQSVASAASAAVTTFGLPGAPTSVTASAIAHGAEIDWTAPAGNGGTPVTGYLVEASLNGAPATHVSPTITGTHAVLNGLSDGGSYTFLVAAVNAVGQGAYSAPSGALVLASIPSTPSITAAAQLQVGATAVTATVVANAGETYAWSIAGGALTNPSGAAGELANGLDTITFDVTAAAGGAVQLQVIATNSVGQSAAGTFTAQVIGAPSQPTITTAAAVTAGDKGITASVIANAGMTYNWSLSSNAVLKGSDLHGVTANGVNTITYDLAAGAVSGSVSISVVEVNPSQQQSTPGIALQTIIAAPGTPVISAPSQVVIGETGITASVVANPGMTYLWSLNGTANFSGGSTAAGTTSGGQNSITFDVAPGPSSIVLTVSEVNAAGASSKTPGTLSIPIGALPSLAIGVALSNGASTPTFQSGATQYATVGMTLQAQVASIPSATYAWSIVSGGAKLHAGDSGTGQTVTLDVTGIAGATFVLRCIASIGSQSVQASQTVTIVAAPAVPAITLDGKGASLSLELADPATHHAAIVSPAGGTTYAWTAAPAADLTSLGQSGTTVAFALAATASANESITVSAIATNAAGTVGAPGTATVHVLPAIAKPVITASSAAVAPAHGGYTASYGTPAAGVTSYTWTLAERINGTLGAAVSCPSTSPSVCTVNGDGSIAFTVDPSLAPGSSLVLGLTAQDASGTTASAAPVELPVIAAPSVNIAFGAPPSGDAFGANITAGSARAAYLTGDAGDAITSILWTISPGAIVGSATGSSVVFNAGSAAAGTTLTLTATVTNAATATSSGPVTVHVVALPAAPTVSVSPSATDPSVASFGQTQYTATLAPGAPAGQSYRWTVTGGTSCSGALCGIAVAAGQDPTKGTFKYTVNAALGAVLSFSAVAVDAAGDAGPKSNVGTQTIVAAPRPPAIAAGFTTPGDPTATTFTAFAPGHVYDLSVAAPRAGFHYVWTVGAETCPSASCHDLSSAGDGSEIEVTADGTITAGTGGAAPAPGAQVSIQVKEVNTAGDSAPAAQPLLVDVIAAPVKPVIQIVDHNGKIATAFLTELTQAQPFVDAIEGQANGELNQTFQWRAVNSIGGASLLASGQTAAGAIGIDPANASQATSYIVIQTPAFAAGEQAKLSVTAINAAASAASDVLNVTLEPAPTAPVLTVPWLPGDYRTPQAISYGAVNVPATFTPALNADGTPMAESCTIDANGTIATPPAAGALAFSVIAAPTALGGTADINTTLTCKQTNAAGDSASGSIVVPLAPPLTVALTPANGATGLLPSVAMTATFSFAPDPTSVTGSGCTGNVTLSGSDSSCVAFTIARDTNNPALFTITPNSPLAHSITYTLTLQGADGSGAKIVDAQGVALTATAHTTFTVQPIPDVTLSASGPTALLQSASISWTNPVDPSLHHVHVTAHATDSSGAPDVSADTTSAAQTSITVAGLRPLVTYTLTAKVSEGAGNATLSAGVTSAAITTALTGTAGDFLAAQTLAGLGPTFNGAGAASFAVAWDANNLYFALGQADGAANALRNNGDALWIGVDVDGTFGDTNGESSTTIGGTTSSNVPDQIIWPFNADYVLEYKNEDGTLVFNLRSIGGGGGTWAQVSGGLMNYNGALAEVVVPGKTFASLASPNQKPSQLRVAMAFLHTPTGGSGSVIDLAPAAYSPDTTDGHTPAIDVLGSLASLTNALDFHAHVFDPTRSATSMTDAPRYPAPSLVTFHVDGTGASFGSSDLVKIEGNLPPLSYTLSDSSYQLADDGTRGSALSSGHYTGVFNFGTGTANQELFFKLFHSNAVEFPGGGDRIWTMSGNSELIGGGGFLVWNTAFGLTHAFELDVTMLVVPGNPQPSTVGILGDQPEIGEWVSLAAAAPLTETSVPLRTWAGTINFTNHDFISGNGSCPGNQNQADAQGCPLNFKGVSSFGGMSYESGGNHSMNDDIINKRHITWTWGDSSTF